MVILQSYKQKKRCKSDMKRKPFKVMTCREEVVNRIKSATLNEVLGYFKTLECEPVFVYFNQIDQLWYVIDPYSGLSITSGETKHQAEKEFMHSTNLKQYRKIRDSESYQKVVSKYQRLLKEEGAKWKN